MLQLEALYEAIDDYKACFSLHCIASDTNQSNAVR